MGQVIKDKIAVVNDSSQDLESAIAMKRSLEETIYVRTRRVCKLFAINSTSYRILPE